MIQYLHHYQSWEGSLKQKCEKSVWYQVFVKIFHFQLDFSYFLKITQIRNLNIFLQVMQIESAKEFTKCQ